MPKAWPYGLPIPGMFPMLPRYRLGKQGNMVTAEGGGKKFCINVLYLQKNILIP